VTDSQPASHVAVASTCYAYLRRAVKKNMFVCQTVCLPKPRVGVRVKVKDPNLGYITELVNPGDVQLNKVLNLKNDFLQLCQYL